MTAIEKAAPPPSLPTTESITMRPLTPDEIRSAGVTAADHAISGGWTGDLPDVLSMLGLDGGDAR